MKSVLGRLAQVAELVSAALLVAIFVTFLLQIFSRYVLQTPFGWTLEFCLLLWVWVVFFGNAFLVRERDQSRFDILYLAVPQRLRQVLALVSAAAIVVGMALAFLHTLDYVEWMKIRETETVENPFTGTKIPLRYVFSIYALFIVTVVARYLWRFVAVLRRGPQDTDRQPPGDEPEPPATRNGDDAA